MYCLTLLAIFRITICSSQLILDCTFKGLRKDTIVDENPMCANMYKKINLDVCLFFLNIFLVII